MPAARSTTRLWRSRGDGAVGSDSHRSATSPANPTLFDSGALLGSTQPMVGPSSAGAGGQWRDRALRLPLRILHPLPVNRYHLRPCLGGPCLCVLETQDRGRRVRSGRHGAHRRTARSRPSHGARTSIRFRSEGCPHRRCPSCLPRQRLEPARSTRSQSSRS